MLQLIHVDGKGTALLGCTCTGVLLYGLKHIKSVLGWGHLLRAFSSFPCANPEQKHCRSCFNAASFDFNEPWMLAVLVLILSAPPAAADTMCVDAGSVPSYTVQTSRALCSAPSSTRVTFNGVPCGPNNALVQWNTMAPTGCTSYTRSTLDVKQQADWLGQCGVPPFQIMGMPTRVCGRFPGGSNPQPPANPPPANPPPANPPPANPPGGGTGKLPSTPLMSGESTGNWGMATVGALDGSRNVVDPRAAIAATGFKVVVVDTGAEQSHPDLNVVEFIDFWDQQGSSYFRKDGNGHGTHVSGK